MTPEEKLLALIQQDKKPAGEAGSPQAGSTGSPQAGSTVSTGSPQAGSPQAGSTVSTGSPQAGSPQAVAVGSVQVNEPSPRKGEGGTSHASVAEVPPEKVEKKLKLAGSTGSPQAGSTVSTGSPQAGSPQAVSTVSTGSPQAGSPQAGSPQAVSTVSTDSPQAGSPQAVSTGSPQAGSPSVGLVAVATEGAGDRGKSVGEVSARKAEEGPGYRKSVQRPGSLNGLVLFNRVLAGVVLVLLGVVVYSVASIRADVAAEGDRLKAGAGTHHVAVVALVKEELPSVDVFLDKVSQRNVFLSVEAKTATSTVAALTGKVADLKLLGVSIDSAVDQESMAIIRNKAESRTYFVKKGQLVGDTGYTLERVLSDRAVLKQGKQEIELK